MPLPSAEITRHRKGTISTSMDGSWLADGRPLVAGFRDRGQDGIFGRVALNVDRFGVDVDFDGIDSAVPTSASIAALQWPQLMLGIL
jgi:hypothetical protein